MQLSTEVRVGMQRRTTSRVARVVWLSSSQWELSQCGSLPKGPCPVPSWYVPGSQTTSTSTLHRHHDSGPMSFHV